MTTPAGFPSFLPPFGRGDKIANYEIEERIAAGLTDVYRARELDGERRIVALKVILAEDVATLCPPELTNGVPHIVETQAIGIDHDQGVGFVAMRFVRGITLATVLQNLAAEKRLPTAEERRRFVLFARQIAGGLAELHRRGALHRDVKPDNIVLENATDPFGAGAIAVLVDLGLVRDPATIADNATRVLAANYAAPEQFLGNRLDGRCDVFALGVSLHDALLGRAGGRRPRLPTCGLESVRVTDPTIDRHLAAIVSECVAVVREHRYRDCAALAADLVRWLTGRRPAVLSLAPWTRFRRLVARRPARALTLTVAVLSSTFLAVLGSTELAASRQLQQRHGELDAALAAGDFDGALRRWPELTAALIDQDGAPTFASCLRLLRAGEAAAARRTAAQLLARQGTAGMPQAREWLLGQLQASATRLHACELLARVGYERPGDDPECVRALLPLIRADDGAAALFALTALGGLGDMAAADQIVAALPETLSAHTNPREFLRLSVEVLHRLAARAASNGDLSAVVERSLVHANACAHRLAGFADLSRWHDLIKPSVNAWTLSLRRWCDRSGRPAPDPGPWLRCWPEDPILRALGRDPSVLTELRTNPSLRGAPRARDIGRVVGLFAPDDAQLATVMSDLRGDPDLATETANRAFGIGRSLAARELVAAPEHWQPDVGSRLVDEFEGATDPIVLTTSAIGPGDELAAWDLRHQPIATSGQAGEVRATAARQLPDEDVPPVPFGWLGSPGRSQFEFTFVEPIDLRRNLTVHIAAQKGLRGSFPFFGDAGLEILLDDVLLATWRDLGSTESATVPLPLVGIESGRRRTLTLRLHTAATTTLRLYRVTID